MKETEPVMSASAKPAMAWGKYDRESETSHALVAHCLDVAMALEAVMSAPRIRRGLQKLTEIPVDDRMLSRLCVLAYLHDVGKLAPGFQLKIAEQAGPWVSHLEAGRGILLRALRMPANPLRDIAVALEDWAGPATEGYIAAMMAHHGRPIQIADAREASVKDNRFDGREDAKAFARIARTTWPEAFAPGGALPAEPAFVAQWAGLLSIADWIGSDVGHFPFHEVVTQDYAQLARRQANRAVRMCGMIGATAPVPDFAALTGFAQPRALQAKIAEIPSDQQLVILEAETGSGKTEAALWRFVHLLAAGEVSALYFAVPTRAAARQLHRRVDEAVQRFLGIEAVLAVPGQLVSGGATGTRLPGWEVRWDDDAPRGARWAAEHATRFLSAQVAVGTVDQVMLAGLQTKHALARGAGLSRALLVVDEVHASDTYGRAVLAPFLRDHMATGGHVLLMSATLGAGARAVFTGTPVPDPQQAETVSYPAIHAGNTIYPIEEQSRGKAVSIETLPGMEASRLAALAARAAGQGARVLVIRNTVQAARDCLAALDDAPCLCVEGVRTLHHARFAVEDRARLDAAVEAALGKASRAGGLVVCGSQTLEQSLDIDADFLITDLAPVDVLLQRFGRLHRHDRARPEGFEQPRAVIALPENGLAPLTKPSFFNGLGRWSEGGIYMDLAGLEATRRLIGAHPIWQIPAMNRMLVERATHPRTLEALTQQMGESWVADRQGLEGLSLAESAAGRRLRLDRAMPFETLEFPDYDEHVATRLGAQGPLLSLQDGAVGPLGPVSQIALPAWWGQGVADEIATLEGEVLNVPLLDGTVRRFGYDRTGLWKMT